MDMDDVKALTAEWGEAVYNARENWTVSPHEHIERLITAGDVLLAALAAPRPSGEREAPADLVALLRVVVDAIRAGDMCSDVYGCGCDVSEAWHQLSELVDGRTARPSPPGERPAIEVGDWVSILAHGQPAACIVEQSEGEMVAVRHYSHWETWNVKHVQEIRKPNGVVWRRS